MIFKRIMDFLKGNNDVQTDTNTTIPDYDEPRKYTDYEGKFIRVVWKEGGYVWKMYGFVVDSDILSIRRNGELLLYDESTITINPIRRMRPVSEESCDGDMSEFGKSCEHTIRFKDIVGNIEIIYGDI